jgi:hypothetical protein
MRTHFGWLAVAVCGLLLLASPARAQQQTVNFTIGGFVPKGWDSRVHGDVLNADSTFLAFDSRDFNSWSLGGEWLFPIGGFLEGGAGVTWTQQTVPTVYRDFVDNFGNEIVSQLRLRRTPIDLTLRFTPFGHRSPVQLYGGGGVAVIPWHYREAGDFVDFNNNHNVFTANYEDSGTQAGPVLLGGVRFQSSGLAVGFETKWHWADAALSNDFAGTRIDLGGWTYQGTVGFRF